MIETAVLKDNEFLRQFELKIEDDLAKVEYSLQERKIFLTKMIVPETLEGEEFENEFIVQILSNIEERNLRVMPTSPKIVKFMRRNRQYKSLLPVGVRI
ncbi:GNAT family N-acetyltransferase [Spongiivirga citrea]|uniref:N-acetyltransferase n=1 Tax=Spongiivirga citrea TaxID=1481457 RepID=A0A6M0CLF0_9FLAO|nr:N-acetyltransferase [Spongiivirga citrea]NER18482.1 N-acetyltransferase [Spongiivirga citrea]